MTGGLAKRAYYFGIAVIVLYSFFCHSPVYSNIYSSDNAIHVLMAYDFNFSTDLYYWGQDRLGSLVPMLSSVPVKLGCSPVYAVSVVQFLLMLSGFLFFSSFIAGKTLKLALCLVWFFPLDIFHAHAEIGHPYTGQLFFLGLSLYSLEKRFLKSRSSFWLFVSVFSFMLSVWMSDLMFFILPVYLFYLLLSLCSIERNHQNTTIKMPHISFKIFLPLVCGLLPGFVFLMVAKKTASTAPPEYDKVFANLSEIGEGFISVTGRMANALLFEAGNVLISYQALAAAALLFLLMIYFFVYRQKHDRTRISFFMTGAILVSFIMVIASNWAQLSQYETRYFCFTFYLFLFFLILLADRIRQIHYQWIAAALCMVLAFSHLIQNQLYVHQQPYLSKDLNIKNLREISGELGDCGILGNYWTSYNIASADPAHIKASAHDDGYVRKPELGRALMMKKNIFVIKDNWLGEFPEALIQFGSFIRKTGRPFQTHGLTLCRYTRVDSIRYPVANLVSRHLRLENQNYIVKNDSTAHVHDLVLFGPRIMLNPGKYRLSFELGALNKMHHSDEIDISLTNSFGEHALWRKNFVLDGSFSFARKFLLFFDLRYPVQNFEMHVFLNGRTQVYVKTILLSERKE